MGFWIFVALAVAVLALRRALRLEGLVRELRGEIVTLNARLSTLARSANAAEPPAPATAAAQEPAQPPVPDMATDGTTPASATSSAASEVPPVETVAVPASGPVIVEIVTESVTALVPEPATAFAPPPPPPAAASASHDAESLERRIGSRWLLYVGVVTLVLGVSYFIKYAFDNEWVAPPARVLLGLIGGTALAWLGQRFAARGFERYGQALTGGGIGILYLAIYAAHHWYALVDRAPAFVAMVIITLAGVWLADRQRSQLLALFAVAIGFLTPFLIGGERAAQTTLFTYDLVLVAGTWLLARRRDWPALNIVSFMLTAMTISTWAERFYRRTEYLTTELFLTAFLGLFLLVLRENRRSKNPIAPLGTALLVSAPLLYHFASLAVLGPHRGPLLVYFIAFSVAGVIAAQHLRTAWLRLAVWLAVAAPFLGFASTRLGRGWLVATWVTLAAIYGLHLIAQAQTLDDERSSVSVPEVLILHGNALWALAAIWLLLAPRTIDGLAPVALALAALYGVLAFAARHWHRDAALHGAALAITLASAACAMHFSAQWVSVALAVEGAALTWLGLRERRAWLRHGGSLFLSMAAALLLVLFASPLSLGSLPFLNARAAASLLVVLLLYAAALISTRLAQPPGSLGFAVARLVVSANVLTVLALSAEISAYFGWSAWTGPGDVGAGAWTSAELARQLTLSIAWAAYAVALIAVGLRIDYRPVRILAIVLFAITLGKVFLIDLAELDRVSRMLSMIGLGLLLLTASWLYQRLRVSTLDEPEPAADTPIEGVER
jgi:uncharacterized membrane protein